MKIREKWNYNVYVDLKKIKINVMTCKGND